MYGDKTPAKVLRHFRLITTVPHEDLREVLVADFGIHSHLVSRLYATHKKCRLQLARAELEVLYSLIPRMRRVMKAILKKRMRLGRRELMSWQNSVRYMGKLEQLLQVGHPRAAKMRLELDKWAAIQARR